MLVQRELAVPFDSAFYREESHLFRDSKGGRGFGMHKQNLPSDRWVEWFANWLDVNGWLKL